MAKQTNKKSSPLGTIIGILILFSFVSYIWDYLYKIIIAVIVLIAVIFAGYVVSISVKRKKESQVLPITEAPQTSLPPEAKNEMIKRNMSILYESTELMNDSNNLDTVLRRYNIVCNTIDKLIIYTDEDFKSAGFIVKEPLSTTKNIIQSNKCTIINQAIERNIKSELDSLKTINGKQRKLDTLYNAMKELPSLEPANISFLNELYFEIKKNYQIDNRESFKGMNGHDFEKYCAHLLSLNGFSSISVTKDSGDQGIDIIAHKGDIKYGIQCKLYSSHVGNSAVQEAYSGKDFYKCQIGAVLTNNDFTESARELANSLGILLWDGNFLYQLQQQSNCE